MSQDQPVEEMLAAGLDGFTPSERLLAGHLRQHYPVAVLGSLGQLASATGVSTPTVLRMVRKLGFSGWPEFQKRVRDEIEARLTSPIARHDRWAGGVPDTHILNRFADAVLSNLSATLARIDHAEFDALAAMMADTDRRIYLTGGRITHALADYMATQLRVLRPGVTLVQASSDGWPPMLLDLAPGDVLLALDIRRYENSVMQLVEMAARHGAVVALLTDPWVSPAAAHARFRFSAQVEVPSVWDSTVALQVLVETLLAAIQGLTWPETERRMKRVEEFYDRARLFRRPRG